MGGLQTITTDGAEELVVLTRAKYDRLIEAIEDAEDIAFCRDLAEREKRGETEYLPWELVTALHDGGNPVALWREHRGLTQRALAKQVGMTPAQLSEIESGKRTGSVATLRKLAGALGVTVDDLLPALGG